MEAIRSQPSTIVDLLDRILEKGLVINADIIISVAGVPLIGVNLRAALAGMETMVRYGIMRESDDRPQVWEREHRGQVGRAVTTTERPILEMRGACYCGRSDHVAWRMGRIYLTNTRLILRHPTCGKVLFETPLDKIKGLTLERDEQLSEAEPNNICLILEEGHTARLHVLDAAKLREAVESQMAAMKATWGGIAPCPSQQVN